MASFDECLATECAVDRACKGPERLPWLWGIFVIAALSLLSWVTVLAVVIELARFL
jgi:hypothetical protein